MGVKSRVRGPSRGLGAFGKCYVLYAIGADHVAVALPAEQAGESDETEETPVVEATVAVSRSALIDIRLSHSRCCSAARQ
jgi:hypothetical protein